MPTILITGGKGLIGQELERILVSRGYKVICLSRQKSTNPAIYYWNVNQNYIDPLAIQQADFIIHLAGAGIAEKRWTTKRKKVLVESRTASTRLLHEKVKEFKPELLGFIAASGIGYYGAISSEKIFHENDLPANDFLSTLCQSWEKESFKFQDIGIRTVVMRTAIVFMNNGGALKKMTQPIANGFGAVLGNGGQFMPWIHIEDLCNMYIKAIEDNSLVGVYNAVAPTTPTNKQLTSQISKTLNKKIWLPPIPSIFLKLLLGEMAIMLLNGSRISSEKIEKTGFKFHYKTFKKAISNLIKS